MSTRAGISNKRGANASLRQEVVNVSSDVSVNYNEADENEEENDEEVESENDDDKEAYNASDDDYGKEEADEDKGDEEDEDDDEEDKPVQIVARGKKSGAKKKKYRMLTKSYSDSQEARVQSSANVKVTFGNVIATYKHLENISLVENTKQVILSLILYNEYNVTEGFFM